MGVAGTVYDTAMVKAALFRSGGVRLENYAYGPATNPDPAASFRKYVASGKGVGHVYVHTEGGGDDISGHGTGLVGKSRYVDHMTMVGAIVEALRHPTAVAALQNLDNNPGTQQWLHGANAIPVTGPWYGYPQNMTVRKKIEKISINMRSHGDALFLSSSYPEVFQVDPPP
jgi:hypothetical protein